MGLGAYRFSMLDTCQILTWSRRRAGGWLHVGAAVGSNEPAFVLKRVRVFQELKIQYHQSQSDHALFTLEKRLKLRSRDHF